MDNPLVTILTLLAFSILGWRAGEWFARRRVAQKEQHNQDVTSLADDED